LTLELPGGSELASDPARFAVSPDGDRLAVNLRSAAGVQVWIRRVDARETQPVALAGTEGVTSAPAWSPDSRTLAFVGEGTLTRIPATGGPAEAIVDLEPDASLDWGRDETILIGAGGSAPIRRVGAAGGTVRPLTRLLPGEQHNFPAFMPDGRRFLFLVEADPFRSGMWVGSLDGGTATGLLPLASGAAVAGEFLVSAQKDSVVAQRFDPATLTLSGSAVTLAGGLRVAPSGRAAFSVSTGRPVLAFQRDDGSLHIIRDWPALMGPP
jgi:hypothetical protein